MTGKSINNEEEASQFVRIDKKSMFYVVILLLVYWLTSLYQSVISSLVLGTLLDFICGSIISFIQYGPGFSL